MEGVIKERESELGGWGRIKSRQVGKWTEIQLIDGLIYRYVNRKICRDIHMVISLYISENEIERKREK